MRRLSLVAVLLLPVAGPLLAQSMSQRFQQLYTFGDCGQPLCLTVNSAVHGEHFVPSVTQGEHNMLAFVTGSIGASLASLPFTAGSGGVTFHFENGAPVATSVSFGPIFAERAQTLGKGRVVAGANVNGISMDNIRGVPLNNLVTRFAHQNVGDAALGDPTFENDIIEVRTDLRLNLDVTSFFTSYGLLDNVDVGILVPVVHSSLSGHSEANVIAFEQPTPHLFGTAQNPSEFADAAASGSAIGIGDIALRVKANLHQTRTTGFAVVGDARLPTGDSANFLGSGATIVRVLGVVTGQSGNFAPHLNAGYAFRSGSNQTNSVLATLGFDQLFSQSVTLAADVITDFQVGASKLVLPAPVVFDQPVRRRVNLTEIPDMRDNLIDASIGLKSQFAGKYRAVTNLLLPLNVGGIRSRFIWTLGAERSF
jgi:hypothetical protein